MNALTRAATLFTLQAQGCTPDEAEARVRIAEQKQRRKQAALVTSVYRSKANGGQPEDIADEEEIEVAVDGEYQGAEPDVGMSGGFVVYGAIRIDNGEPIELTPDEIQTMEEEQSEASVEEDGDSAWDRRADS